MIQVASDDLFQELTEARFLAEVVAADDSYSQML